MGWNVFTNNFTKDNKIRLAYCPALRTTFACNGVDATVSFDGNNGMTWSSTTNVTGAPIAKVPFQFGKYIYLFNCIVNGVRYPTRGYRSSEITASLTWDTTNDWFDFTDEVVGVGLMGDNLFVGCNNSCYYLTQNDQYFPLSTVNCVSHESIVSYGKFVFWGASDGYYASNGGEDQKISLPIQDYWDAVPQANKSSIHAEVLGQYIYLYLGDITVDGRDLANVYFIYDILQNDWNRGSFSVDSQSFHKFVNSGGEAVFMGDNNGKVYQLFTSGSQDTGEISASLETEWLYGSGARFLDDFLELWVHGNDLSGLQVFYKIDKKDNKWMPIGQLNGESACVKFRVRGTRIKFLLAEASKNNLYEIHALEYGHEKVQEKSYGLS